MALFHVKSLETPGLGATVVVIINGDVVVSCFRNFCHNFV